jgi:hypothetical protein
MDNTEILATLGTHDTGLRQTKQKQHNINFLRFWKKKDIHFALVTSVET